MNPAATEESEKPIEKLPGGIIESGDAYVDRRVVGRNELGEDLAVAHFAVAGGWNAIRLARLRASENRRKRERERGEATERRAER